MKLMKFLINTSSHEILNMAMGVFDDARMRKEPSFQYNMANYQAERYRMILRTTPIGPNRLRYTG